MVSLVTQFFPDLPHQRCLAHVVKTGKRLCPAGSPYIFTLKLREIFEDLMSVFDPADYYDWVAKLDNWLINYHSVLKTQTHHLTKTKSWWYTHGNLRRAVKLLTKNQDSLFQFLHYNFLPKTNNSLEGVNSQLKHKLGSHRGMQIPQQVTFCLWALAFSRVKTPTDLKKLWDYWKRRR